MLKKILRASRFIVLTVFLFVSSFSDINPVEAAQMSSDSNEDSSMGIVIEKSNGSIEEPMTSSAPDLGDDQAFPFIPGFGKNSGKD